MSPFLPKRLGDVPTGLSVHHREWLQRLKDAVEILMGAVAAQGDTDDNPGSKAVTFDDLETRVVSIIAVTVSPTTRITSADSPYTVLNSDEIIFADTDGGAIAINLLAGVEGKYLKIINVGTSGNNAVVDPNGTEQLFSGGAGISFGLIDSEIIAVHFNSVEGWW